MYDVLIILAAIANIGTFLFQIKQEIQTNRTVKEDKKKGLAATNPFNNSPALPVGV